MLKYKGQPLTNDEAAVITHYLQNANTKYVSPFEKSALKMLHGKKVVEQAGIANILDGFDVLCAGFPCQAFSNSLNSYSYGK